MALSSIQDRNVDWLHTMMRERERERMKKTERKKKREKEKERERETRFFGRPLV